MQALGGRLEIAAVFDDDQRVTLEVGDELRPRARWLSGALPCRVVLQIEQCRRDADNNRTCDDPARSASAWNPPLGVDFYVRVHRWEHFEPAAIIDSTSDRRSTMAQLIVRNLDDELVGRLKRRAAERGHSAEEEHREILRQVLAAPPREALPELLLSMPDVGDDSDFARQDDTGRAVEW